jgi:flagellar hook-length control protein FliK
MTAGFFIATPSSAGPAAVATGLPGVAHGVTGSGITGSGITGSGGAATGFEALLAAFFGNQATGTATAQAALLSGKAGVAAPITGAAAALGANDNADDPAKAKDGKTGDAKTAAPGQAISAEVQALAALMATPITPPAAPTADTPKTDTSASAGAAFAAQKLLTPAAAKAQAAADQAASALTAGADAAAGAKDAASTASDKAAAAKPGPPDVSAKIAAPGASPSPANAATPAEAVPYGPPAAARAQAAAPQAPAPTPAEAAQPAATTAPAADLAAVEAASTATTGPAPVKAKDLAPSHTSDQVDAGHRTTGDPPTLNGATATSVIRHPVAPVAPIAAKTGEQIGAGDKPPADELKLIKIEEPGAATQPAAVAAADHTTQAGATASAAARATPETVSSLAAQILRKADGRTSRFDVELHPADLGRVDVRLEIGANGRMTAAMSFENPQAAAELRGRAHELQAALEHAGFDVSGGLTFDVAGDRGQGGQNLAGQQQQPDGGGASRGRAFQAALQSAGDTTAAANSAAVYGQGRTTSGVDIRI